MAQNVQFRVIIPSNVKPGQMLRIRCPDGTEGDVRVPKGLKPGNSFIFEMPAGAFSKRSASQTYFKKFSDARTGVSDFDYKCSSTKSHFFSLTGGFLDREIVDKQDFITALAVGLFVGLSIVAGFLLGVIIVTEP